MTEKYAILVNTSFGMASGYFNNLNSTAVSGSPTVKEDLIALSNNFLYLLRKYRKDYQHDIRDCFETLNGLTIEYLGPIPPVLECYHNISVISNKTNDIVDALQNKALDPMNDYLSTFAAYVEKLQNSDANKSDIIPKIYEAVSDAVTYISTGMGAALPGVTAAIDNFQNTTMDNVDRLPCTLINYVAPI